MQPIHSHKLSPAKQPNSRLRGRVAEFQNLTVLFRSWSDQTTRGWPVSSGPRTISVGGPLVNGRTDSHVLLGHQAVTVRSRAQLVCNQYPTCRFALLSLQSWPVSLLMGCESAMLTSGRSSEIFGDPNISAHPLVNSSRPPLPSRCFLRVKNARGWRCRQDRCSPSNGTLSPMKCNNMA